ncbi:hypothetical protein KJ885_01605 [Patescibacteria group bacterium]|nr:hypothetical protein [Patescibacteria group bacterium]
MEKQDPFELPYLKKHFEDEEKVKEIEEKINDLPQQVKRKVMKAKEENFEKVLDDLVENAKGKMKKWEQGSKTHQAKESMEQLERLQNLRKEILFGGDKKDEKEKTAKKRVEILRKALKKPEEEIEIADSMIESAEPVEDIGHKFDLSDAGTAEDSEWFKTESLPDADKNFSKLEQAWFKEGEKIDEENMLASLEKLTPKQKDAAMETQAKSLDMYYRRGLENMGLSWQEYEDSSKNLIIADQERERIENHLFQKFGYDVTRGGMWRKFKARRKLDPEDLKEFDNLTTQYKTTAKTYNKGLKNHNKKFAGAIEDLTPKNRSRIYLHGRSMPLRGVGIGMKE